MAFNERDIQGFEGLLKQIICNELDEDKRRFDLKEYCTLPNGKFFQKQYEFIDDPARFKTLDKSRRAGGTMSLAGMLMGMCSEISDINLAYVTLDRGTAERIIWHELIKLNEDWELGAKFNQQKLWVEFPNRSMVYMAGTKDRNEINKLRGKAFKLVALDECQSFRDAIMRELIDDVLEASLIDYGGSLLLVGTPNAACAGFFYEACRSKGYKHFHWTMDDNPWLPFKSGKQIKDIQAEHLERKGITRDDPSFQREWLGKWIKDKHSLVYRFEEARNVFDVLPENTTWHYILSCDIGWHDADAICVWAFSPDFPQIFLAYCEESSHQSISEFAHRCKLLEEKYGSFVSRVIDTGGLGKKITEELKSRHQLYFKPAEKTRKQEFIKLMNNDFQNGSIKIRMGLPIIEELSRLQWDTSKDPPIEDARFSNDLTDASLYGWRESKHYTWKESKRKPQVGSKEYVDNMWNKLANHDQKPKDEWWEQL